jgi:hypothetical protein
MPRVFVSAISHRNADAARARYRVTSKLRHASRWQKTTRQPQTARPKVKALNESVAEVLQA